MIKLTDAQKKAVNLDDSNIVVSASAGSGKTKIMIERIGRLLIEKKCEIDDILATTFTKLSANDIKKKISQKLIEQLEKGGDDDFIKRQIEKLPVANISTVHSFCVNMLKTYFYAVDLNSDFSLIDDSEKQQFVSQALDDVFDELYENGDENLKLLLDIFISGRTDSELRGYVLKVYANSIDSVNPYKYLSDLSNIYSEDGLKIIDNRLIAHLNRLIEYTDGFLLRAIRFSEDVGSQSYLNYFSCNKENFDKLKNSPDKLKAFAGVKLKQGSKPRKSKDISCEEEAEFKFLSDEMSSCFDEITDFASQFCYDKSVEIENAKNAKATVEAFSYIAKKFMERYAEIKATAGRLDFNDLEHKMLELLEIEDVKNEIKSRFKYIFVDEYQDTNDVQEAIFSALANDNVFVVGDIKQSIYAFRGCDPMLFKDKINSCLNGYGEHLSLDDNFRSTKKVIDFVNNVFSQIMFEENASCDYAKNPMIYGGLYGECEGEATMHVFEKLKPDKQSFQGVYSVKKHIAEMREGLSFDEEHAVCNIVEDELNRKISYLDSQGNVNYRNVEYKDICVITRKNKGLSTKILNELTKRAIPAVTQSDRQITDYPEIIQMRDIVRFICSPYRDIALCSALKSWAGDFSDRELSMIRESCGSGTFLNACQVYMANKTDGLSKKLRDFFEYFEELRIYAQFESAENTLYKLLADKSGEVKLLGTEHGKSKCQRIKLFITSSKNMSIYDFEKNLDSILSNLTFGESGIDNTVKIINAHKTKGLEYPIVILCENNSRSQNRDALEFNKAYGLGVKCYDREKRLRSSNVFHSFIKFINESLESTEEMRLFYVALTRARERLHIVLDKAPALEHSYIKAIKGTKGYDFLAMSDGEIKQEDIRIVELQQKNRDVVISNGDKKLMDEIDEFIGFEYPYNYDCTLNLKRSVTGIVSDNYQALGEDKQLPYQTKPLFDNGSDLIDTGVAYHKFMQYADFEESASIQLEKMKEQGLFEEDELNMLDATNLQNVLDMEVFRSLKGFKLYKEQPFILNVPAKVIDENAKSDETVLVQGVIDLLAIKDDNAVIIDYKYSGKDNSALENTYKKQLELYAYAVEKIQGVKVSQKTLVNLKRQNCVTLTNK